jgi:hypothetical protein
MLDRAPIFAALVGLSSPSSNSATGAMLQVYIMRSDIAPQAAVASGADSSVCGSCAMRGRVLTLEAAEAFAWSLDGSARRSLLARIAAARLRGDLTLNVERPCYVRLEQAPSGIFKAYQAGRYELATTPEAVELVRGRALRIGAYGDSAALPVGVVRPLADVASAALNYTHAAGYAPGRADRLGSFTMASADSIEQAQRYQQRGLRTFRVSPVFELVAGVRRVLDIQPGEAQCPKTIDKAIQCIDCGLCDGLRRGLRGNIVAPAHGKGAAYL